MKPEISGLVAYPSEPQEIGQTIKSGLDQLRNDDRFSNLKSWEENDIPGKFIDSVVLSEIDKGSIFIADISYLNFNVVFEIGYAIGRKKRVFLIVNDKIRRDAELIRQVGLFETLGYSKYKDHRDLVNNLLNISDLTHLMFEENKLNKSAPVYLLLPQIKGDYETHLIARIKKAKLFYRSFDPDEQGHLSLLDTLENVSTSHGVILPLLQKIHKNVQVHNFRVAFTAGLAYGMEKCILLIQSGDDPIPIDYRSLVKSFKHLNQINEHVAQFAIDVIEKLQLDLPHIESQTETIVSKIRLGASSAENEFQELGHYYIETEEFRRALRGEVQVVLGRKGSGKTALFYQIRDRLRQDAKNVVLDLKPEGFQLIKFREQVLDYLEKGTKEHTITAFWEYLLLLEICHKLLQNDKDLHMRNHNLFEPYQRLKKAYEMDEYVSEGDFAERMLRLTQRISEDFTSQFGMETVQLPNEKITQLIYKHDVNELRSELIKYLGFKQSMWILFDNLDKGWPPLGVTEEDVLTLRCLIDSMRKLENSFHRFNIKTKCLVFLRNDVFENLIANTPDRGKIASALLDWSDSELLCELLRKRFLYSGISGNPEFMDIWRKICISHIDGEETSNYFIERSLMRPRSLIDFFRFCRGHAANLQHNRIEKDDIEQGEEQFSSQLVNDIGFEIQDVLPIAKDVLYEFIECPAKISKREMDTILDKIYCDQDEKKKIFEMLLWYGFIGFQSHHNEPIYIYHLRYDMKKMSALLKKRETDGVEYLINPAFWKGLEIKH